MSPGDNRSPSERSPPEEPGPSQSGPGRGPGSFTQFRRDHAETFQFLREIVTSVASVVVIGLLLFAISGVWPPMVAVESGSMEPHMERGDLIFITTPDRFT
ncbi:MAG: S26 family signal peptidase, partial [Halobacteriota archaeon]